jgi:hypothetical protein
VLSPQDLEVMIGDLEEERRLRSVSMPPQQVAGWYWSQVLRSVPPLLWASIRRGGVLTTVATAVAAVIVQANVELATKSAMSSLIAYDAPMPALLSLFVTVPTLVFVSYVATQIRPGAAVALTALIVLAVTVELIVKTGYDMSIWNQVAALLVGPSAAFAGGVLAVRKSHARAK